MKPDQEGMLLVKYIFDNKEIVKEFNKLYPDKKEDRVFKIIISRRDDIVRISIYQIMNIQGILENLPYSIERNGIDTFLLYTGMEVINDRVSKDELIESLGKSMLSKHKTFFNPKVLQFDIDLQKHIQFNYPPVNPYDIDLINTDESKFPKIK